MIEGSSSYFTIYIFFLFLLDSYLVEIFKLLFQIFVFSIHVSGTEELYWFFLKKEKTSQISKIAASNTLSDLLRWTFVSSNQGIVC